VRPVGWSEWQRIDAVEKERGKRLGKEREKVVDVEEMLKIVDGS